MPSEKTESAVVEIAQLDTTVSVSVCFLTEEAADAFFHQVTSEHLDKGTITITSARGDERRVSHAG
jgi:hypothetical protein